MPFSEIKTYFVRIAWLPEHSLKRQNIKNKHDLGEASNTILKLISCEITQSFCYSDIAPHTVYFDFAKVHILNKVQSSTLKS